MCKNLVLHPLQGRRNFLKKYMALGTTMVFAPEILTAASIDKKDDTPGNNFTFLFQGDSITDGNRSRDNDWNHVMGHGYQFIIASRLWYDFPKKGFHFFNRGVSGNKVTDLAGRWQKDTLDLKPDLLSILIGINDTSASVAGDKNFTQDTFGSVYRQLLEQTKQQLPGIEFVICEPFILPVGNIKSKWQEYSSGIKKRQQTARDLAEEFKAIYVPFQEAFNKALQKAPAEYWIWDGIHPMPAGHELMAREWISRVSKKLKFIR